MTRIGRARFLLPSISGPKIYADAGGLLSFTLNMRTAGAIGLAIPRELRLHAHATIE